MRKTYVRAAGVLSGAVALLGVSVGAAQAVQPTANSNPAGTTTKANYQFTSDHSFSVSSVDVYDTRCDGNGSRGNFQSTDAYDDVFTYANRDNTSGCNQPSPPGYKRWSNLTGSNGLGVFKVRVRAQVLNDNYYGWSAYSTNPYAP